MCFKKIGLASVQRRESLGQEDGLIIQGRDGEDPSNSLQKPWALGMEKKDR